MLRRVAIALMMEAASTSEIPVNYTVQHPRTQSSLYLPPWEPEILHLFNSLHNHMDFIWKVVTDVNVRFMKCLCLRVIYISRVICEMKYEDGQTKDTTGPFSVNCTQGRHKTPGSLRKCNLYTFLCSGVRHAAIISRDQFLRPDCHTNWNTISQFIWFSSSSSSSLFNDAFSASQTI
jgi:hypothetical protein